MTVIRLHANDQKLVVYSAPKLASGDKNSVTLHVTFDWRWDGYSATAVFHTSLDSTVYEVILKDGRCVVPHEVLEAPGRLYIGVRGVNAEDVKTSNKVRFWIDKGAPTGTDTVKEPTPDVYQQIVNRLDKVENANPEFSLRTDNTLSYRDGMLSVNCCSSVDEDNTLPITAAAVAVSVGNIETLLKTI